jgi:hypothetical protein
MFSKQYIILSFCFSLFGTHLFAQDSTNSAFTFGDGLTLHGGLGYFAVRDEFISNEKYSGSLPLFAASWSRLHDTYGYRLTCAYQFTQSLKNNNVSAEINQFSLGFDFLYPVGKTSLFTKRVFILLGPSSELFVHFRRQNIAGSNESILNAYSFALLISGGIRSEAYCPINSDLQLQSSVGLSILSFGGRIVNPTKSDESFFKLLSVWNGLRASAELGVRYRITSSMTGTLGYRLEITRLSAWDNFLAGADFLTITISYNL